MLLERLRAERDRGQRHVAADRVVRVADRDVHQPGEPRHPLQAREMNGRGIDRHRVEGRHLRRARLPQHFDRPLRLLVGLKTEGDLHSSPRRAHHAQELPVRGLAGADLEERHAESDQKVDRRRVVRRREERQAALRRVRLELGEGLWRELAPGHPLVPAPPQLGRATDELRRPPRLELHGVGARVGSHVHELPREVEVAVVVHARLGDDEAGLARTDAAPVDRHHAVHPPSTTRLCPVTYAERSPAR